MSSFREFSLLRREARVKVRAERALGRGHVRHALRLQQKARRLQERALDVHAKKGANWLSSGGGATLTQPGQFATVFSAPPSLAPRFVMAALQNLPPGFLTSATCDSCIHLGPTVFYQVHVQTLQGAWHCSCRYSQFRDLAERVNRSGVFRHDPSGMRSSFDLADGMPTKTASWFQILSATEIEERRVKLHDWLQALLSSPLAQFVRPMIYDFLQVPQHIRCVSTIPAQQETAIQPEAALALAVALSVGEGSAVSQATPSATTTADQDPAQQKGAAASAALSAYPTLPAVATGEVVLAPGPQAEAHVMQASSDDPDSDASYALALALQQDEESRSQSV
jgi:hypothetical protein